MVIRPIHLATTATFLALSSSEPTFARQGVQLLAEFWPLLPYSWPFLDDTCHGAPPFDQGSSMTCRLSYNNLKFEIFGPIAGPGTLRLPDRSVLLPFFCQQVQ